MDFFNVIIALIITGIFFLLVSLIIREVIEILKIEHNTFHKSLEIAGVIALLAFLQFFVSEVPILSSIIGILMIVVLCVLVKRFYGLSYGKTFLAVLIMLSIFMALLILLAYVLLILN